MTFVRVLGRPYLRASGLRCIATIVGNFFILQWKLAFLGRVPVTNVDHRLDEKIPFIPGKVGIYIDFVAFWVRSLSFLLKNCGRRAMEPVKRFIESIGGLYIHAAGVYKKHLSTTTRPFYIGRPRFLLIHALDPHLMCIPSLHVMVVIRGYTLFRQILKNLGEEERFAAQAEEQLRGALAITEAVLYVKQHSVNCIPAALYAMTKYDPALFPPEEAEKFVSGIFSGSESPNKTDSEEIRQHILSLYRRFMAEGENSIDWKEPLFTFLEEMPR